MPVALAYSNEGPVLNGDTDGFALDLHNFDHFPCLVFCKDLEANFVYHNNVYEEKLTPILGSQNENSPWYLLSEDYRRTDEIALKHGYYEGVEPLIVDGEIRAASVKKTALKNPHGEVIGVLGFVELLQLDVRSLNLVDNISSIALTKKSAQILFEGLTQRESEVLYFLVRGDSAAAIAEKLGLALTTVVGYLDNIKSRFMVNSKAELICKAIDMGFIFFKPERLSGH